MNNKIVYSDLKRSALNNLEGRWGLSIGVFLIGIIVINMFSGFEEIINKLLIHSNKEVLKIVILVILFGIISSFIRTIVNYGMAYFSLNIISDNRKANLEDLFKGLASIPRLIPIWIIQGICMGALLLPFSINSALNEDYSGSSINLASTSSHTASGEGILIMMGLVISIVHLLLSAYTSQTYYICIESPEKPPIECIKESFRMMKGYVFKHIFLALSFIGWMILSIFTCGIGLLWLTPYINITLAEFHEKVKEIYYEKNNTPIY